MKRRIQLLPVSLLAALSFVVCGSANALTFARVNGSGDLVISVTGAAYFDFSDLDLTDLTLSAESSVVLGESFPTGVPGTPTDRIDLPDIVGTTNLSILDDAYFDEFDFAGSLAIEADRIHAIGRVRAPGGIMVTAPSIALETGITIDSGLAEDSCNSPDAGIVIRSGRQELLDIECTLYTIVTPDLSVIPFPDVRVVISSAIPEPSGGLLFAAGVASFAAWNRRR